MRQIALRWWTSPVMIFAVPSALYDWPAMNSLVIDASMGSLPLNPGSLAGSFIEPIDRILSLSPGQPSMPTASIAATLIEICIGLEINGYLPAV
jgi:hypothetical protein